MSPLLLACAFAGTALLPTPLRPDTVLIVPGGPRIVHMSTPGSPIVSLRLSVPLSEGPTESGSARLLQSIAIQRVQSLVQRIGAKVEARRTGYGITYTVSGPREEFEYLAWILREAVAQPQPETAQLDRARAIALARLAQNSESPRAFLVEALRERIAPLRAPSRGTPLTLARATGVTLRAFWARTHQPESMTVVVVGELPLEALLAAFQGMGAPAEGGAPPVEASAQTWGVERPQVIRSWHGEARAVGPVDDPRAVVVARLLAGSLRRVDAPVEVEVELWDDGGLAVLALIGSAAPGDNRELVEGVEGALGSLGRELDEGMVSTAVEESRLALLLEARSPAGLAEVIGRHFDSTGAASGDAIDAASGDATGAASGAESFLQALEGVTLEGIVEFLAGIGDPLSVHLEGSR